MNTNNALAHLTIENIEKLALVINAKYRTPISAARDLAEFHLRYSSSYGDGLRRISNVALSRKTGRKV